LGANDGIVSTASLVLGVAARNATHGNVMVAGIAGWLLGRCRWLPASTCRSARSWIQRAAQPGKGGAQDGRAGRAPGADAIYVGRGLDQALAKQVAEQLMAHDALGAHARDELGITETLSARPIQAAFTSAASFAVGAAMPLLAAAAGSGSNLIPVVSGTSLVFLAILGALAARVGGANVAAGAMRVTFWGALAMALTAGAGTLFGTLA
jgi:VIT1/CCC1 family predicted Fe2+/Mn2+ transporter